MADYDYQVGDWLVPIEPNDGWVKFKVVRIFKNKIKIQYSDAPYDTDMYYKETVYHWLYVGTFKIDYVTRDREELAKDMKEVFNGERKKDTSR